MRSAQHPAGDLTAKARIRDAAIRCLAAEGMGASVRTVAAAAGVSPALVLHHFGSRAGLREACDAYVLGKVREDMTEVLGEATGGAFLAQLAQVEGYAHLVGYVLRCLQEGGELAALFVQQLAADAVGYLEEGVRAGMVRPSRDPRARARLVVELELGALLVHLATRPGPLDLADLPAFLRDYSERTALPLLELYTEPLLTDSTLLDTFLAARPGAAATGTGTAGATPSPAADDGGPGTT
jgi:AcrR family transcriptional regulator